MSAYIIVGTTPKDTDSLQRYGALVPATLAKYSGEILIKGPVEQLHGEFNYQAQVIIEFPSKEDALNWYNSDEYQALTEIRNKAMDSQFQLIG